MLLNNIKLGLKDILKDNVLVLFYILFFACVTYTVISTTASLADDVRRPSVNRENYTTFDSFLVGKRLRKPEQLLENLSKIYEEKAFSYCAASLKTEKNSVINAYLFFGEPSEVYPYLKTEEDFSIFAGKEVGDKGRPVLNEKVCEINNILEKNYEFEGVPGLWENTDELVFVVVKRPALSQWIHEEEQETLFELVGNTHILNSDGDRIQKFLDLGGSDFVDIRIQTNRYEGQAGRFILKQMYPFLLVLLLCYFLCTSIILDGVIKRRTKEFTLHLLQGGSLAGIMLRLTSYYVFIMLGAIALCFFLGIAQIGELWLYFLVDAAFILAIGVMILLKLKKKNLDENLKVGGTE